MYPMNIGEAAAAARVTPKMIRHYESLGLIPPPERTEAGYRLYTRRDVDMLRFVRQARALGFSIPLIDSLLRLWRDEQRESRAVQELARAQLEDIEQRRRELDQMSAALTGLIEDCAGDEGAGCPILERLSSPLPRELPVAPGRPANTLKQVKPGSRAARKRSEPAAPARQPRAPHAGLTAWSRSFAVAG